MIEIKSTEIGYLTKRNIYVGKPTLDRDYGIHGHDFFEIEFFLGGHGKSTINGKEVILQAGRINFLTANDFHDIRHDSEDDPLELLSVRFIQTVLNPVILKKIFETNQSLTFQLDSREAALVESVMRVMLDAFNNTDSMAELMMVNILEMIVILLLRKTDAFKSDRGGDKTHISRAIGFLETNFFNDPSLSEVAGYVGLNKNYFSTVFHKETGKTFVQYSNNLKLKYEKICLLPRK